MNAKISTPTESQYYPTVLDVLTRNGYRLTEPRKQVIAVVFEQSKPFTAEQIVAKAPLIGRATVYRTLEILASVDLLHRLLKPGGFPAYVVSQPGHRHHLVCDSCDLVIEFTDCPIDDLARHLAQSTDFSISSHHLEVTGLCPKCQTANTPT